MTAKGKWFIAAVVAVFASAYGLSHNLLFLFGSFLLALSLYNFFTARLNLYKLEVRILDVEGFFAGQTRNLPVQLINTKRIFRSSSIGVTLTYGANHEAKAMADHVPSRGQSDLHIPICPQKRGVLTLSGIRYFSAHPFGFFCATRPYERELQTLVYPRLLGDVPEVFEYEIKSGGAIPQRTGDYQYLDSYRHGEDVRMIHWRKSTLSEQPIVKRDSARHQAIRARLFVPDQCDHFEFAVSWIATLVARSGEAISWAIWTSEGIESHASRQEMLEALALVASIKAEVDVEALRRDGYIPVCASSLPPDGSPEQV